MSGGAGHCVAAVAAVVGPSVVVVVVTIGGARGSLRARVGELLVYGFLLHLKQKSRLKHNSCKVTLTDLRMVVVVVLLIAGPMMDTAGNVSQRVLPVVTCVLVTRVSLGLASGGVLTI